MSVTRTLTPLTSWWMCTGPYNGPFELQSALGDPQQLIATMDRRLRLARRIVADRGWHPEAVSAWVVFADTRTNRRRVAAHRGLLRARFPTMAASCAAGSSHPTEQWRASPTPARALTCHASPATTFASSHLASVARRDVWRVAGPIGADKVGWRDIWRPVGGRAPVRSRPATSVLVRAPGPRSAPPQRRRPRS